MTIEKVFLFFSLSQNKIMVKKSPPEKQIFGKVLTFVFQCCNICLALRNATNKRHHKSVNTSRGVAQFG